MVAGPLIGLAETVALLRTVTGRARPDTRVPLRSDGLDRVLTLVQRVHDPDHLLDMVGELDAVPPTALQPPRSVHLTVLDLTDLVPLGHPEERDVAADRLARHVTELAIPMPSSVRLGRIGATEASVFVTVVDPAAVRARATVAAALGRRTSLRDRAHVINLARFSAPPSPSALWRLPRRRVAGNCTLAPPQLVWTDKYLSDRSTTVVGDLGA